MKDRHDCIEALKSIVQLQNETIDQIQDNYGLFINKDKGPKCINGHIMDLYRGIYVNY